VIVNLVVVPFLWFAWGYGLIPNPFPSNVIELLYMSNIVLLIVAGIIYWIGKRR